MKQQILNTLISRKKALARALVLLSLFSTNFTFAESSDPKMDHNKNSTSEVGVDTPSGCIGSDGSALSNQNHSCRAAVSEEFTALAKNNISTPNSSSGGKNSNSADGVKNQGK